MNLFKFLDKKTAADKAPQIEAPERITEAAEENLEREKLENEEPHSLLADLETVKQTLNERGDIPAEEFTALTGMDARQFLKYATGERHVDHKDLRHFNDILKQSLTEQLEEYRPGAIKRFLRTAEGKAAFVSLLLFFKFAPHAEAAKPAAPETNQLKFHTEVSSELKVEGGAGTTKYNDGALAYHGPNPGASEAPAEAAPSIESLSKLDLSNSFETDKADINSYEAANIQAQFSNFLDRIDQSNFHQVVTGKWLLQASSDPRPTTAWDSNLDLTQARSATAIQILNEELKNHNWQFSKLNSQQIKDLTNKTFALQIPQSLTGAEKGVTYPTDLVNPSTGQKWTTKELAKLDKNGLESVLADCRYVKVILLADAQETIKPMKAVDIPPLPGKIMAEKVISFEKYAQVILVVDDSPSMQPIRESIVGALTNRSDKPAAITVASFSDKIDQSATAISFHDAAKKLELGAPHGDSHEKALTCCQNALEKLVDRSIIGEKLINICTDESLQDVNLKLLTDLKEAADKKGVHIQFSMVVDKGQAIVDVSLDNVIKSFLKTGSVYDKAKNRFASLADNHRIKGNTRRAAQKAETGLEEQTFNLQELIADNGQTIKMETY